MRNPGMLPNGQVYFKREKLHGRRRDAPARMPSKKQRRRWRRMLKRKHMSAEQYQRKLSRNRWWQIRYSGQRG